MAACEREVQKDRVTSESQEYNQGEKECMTQFSWELWPLSQARGLAVGRDDGWCFL